MFDISVRIPWLGMDSVGEGIKYQIQKTNQNPTIMHLFLESHFDSQFLDLQEPDSR